MISDIRKKCKNLLDPDVTSCLTLHYERRIALKRRFYHTGQFAKKASVTLRTLRYYDKVGLLSPTQYTESGYRLYAEEDLFTLQHILALKFLGFSLEDIRLCLRHGTTQLETVLAQQRAMMEEKRRQLDTIIKAIAKTEALLQAGNCDWESIAGVIQVIQMEQKSEWVKKYFTEEQIQKMDELSKASYSEEATQKLEQRRGAWTEEDQQRADEQWKYVATEANRLAAIGADPAGEDAQALAKFKSDLLLAFTQGDPQIEEGLGNFWRNFQSLPTDQRPFDNTVYTPTDAGTQLLDRAMDIYQGKS